MQHRLGAVAAPDMARSASSSAMSTASGWRGALRRDIMVS
jgi:hypothetical protein